ncbi:MAG: NUDIX hydrolase [Acetobacteraceae bacterium]|nr:NUDIX hydrolase [Acetobacteraceae bacterium]
MTPDWVLWAHEIQAAAQNGLVFAQNHYDQERYAQLQRLAVRMMAARSDTAVTRIADLFAGERGYATPKSGVRGAAFRDGKLLLVREIADGGRWTLPGGWADVGLSPAQNVVKEFREETGFIVTPRKLVGVLDNNRQGHPPAPFHIYVHYFLCDIVGGEATLSSETSEIAFFAEDALPDDLSHDRVTRGQLLRMFAHQRDDGLATDFD